MPNMAAIVAKNAAAMNVTFDAVVSSAGEASPAIWSATTMGDSEADRPRLEVLGRKNANKNVVGRKVNLKLRVPVYIGVNNTRKYVDFFVDSARENDIPDSAYADAVAYFQSLTGSDLIRLVFNSTYAPN